jgi:hypothetical protein
MLREARDRDCRGAHRRSTTSSSAQARKRSAAANERNQCLVVLEGTHLFVAVFVNWDAVAGSRE